MDTSTTFRPNGDSVTQASGGPIPTSPGVAGPGVIDPNFIALLRKIQAARQPPISGGGASSFGGSAPHVGKGFSETYDPMKGIREQAQIAQLQAISGTAPQRLTTFASGAVNGYTPDPGAMTGAQRAAFLPNGSGQQGDFGGDESAQKDAVYRKWAMENAKREPSLHGINTPGTQSGTGY